MLTFINAAFLGIFRLPIATGAALGAGVCGAALAGGRNCELIEGILPKITFRYINIIDEYDF
jgi:hypothetical protein